jgi:glycolate oxidase FAD binding subunit
MAAAARRAPERGAWGAARINPDSKGVVQTIAEQLSGHLRAAVPTLRVRTEPDPALSVDGRMAWALVEPASEEELAAVVALAASEGWRLHVRGSGGQESMGEPIRDIDLVVSLAGLSGVTDYEPEDLTIGAWAGTSLDALAEILGGHGQRLPNPPVAARATVGGMVATGRSGPFRLGYRTPRDSVLGLRLCLADGSLVRTGSRVVKNVAGYDLTRLMVGSLGTLAVVVQAFVRVAPLPRHSATVWLLLDDASAARAAGRAWQDDGLEPVALEYLDARAAEATGLGSMAGLLAAFEDEPAAVEAQVAAARALAGASAMSTLAAEAALPLWARLHRRPGAAALLVRVSAPPADLPAALQAVEAARGAAGRAPLATRAGVLVGSGHLWGEAGDVEADAAFVAAARAEAEGRGGALVLERAPLPLRARAGVFGRPPAAVERMKGVKAALDPAGILGPGRLFRETAT